MKNKKGLVGLIFFSMLVPMAAGTFLAAAWHIPAWEQAKAQGKEAEYQAQAMWPQQMFAKLPGGYAYEPRVVLTGNHGDFKEGFMN